MTEDRLAELSEKFEATKDPETKQSLRKDIHEELKTRSQFTFDLDNLPAVKHRWVDRGLIMSCEGAGHANHRHVKMR